MAQNNPIYVLNRQKAQFFASHCTFAGVNASEAQNVSSMKSRLKGIEYASFGQHGQNQLSCLAGDYLPLNLGFNIENILNT